MKPTILLIAVLYFSSIPASHALDLADRTRHLELFEETINISREVEQSKKLKSKPLGVDQIDYETDRMRHFIYEKMKADKSRNLKSEQLGYVHGKVYELVQDGKYKVKLWFENDSAFPTMYGGSGFFNLDKSNNFFESKSKEILAHYLGADHSRYNAKVYFVNDLVGISLLISESSQLKEFLALPRLVNAEHIGSFQIDVIELLN